MTWRVRDCETPLRCVERIGPTLVVLRLAELLRTTERLLGAVRVIERRVDGVTREVGVTREDALRRVGVLLRPIQLLRIGVERLLDAERREDDEIVRRVEALLLGVTARRVDVDRRAVALERVLRP